MQLNKDHTIADGGAQRDVLLRGGGLLGRSHFEFADWFHWRLEMQNNLSNIAIVLEWCGKEGGRARGGGARQKSQNFVWDTPKTPSPSLKFCRQELHPACST